MNHLRVLSFLAGTSLLTSIAAPGKEAPDRLLWQPPQNPTAAQDHLKTRAQAWLGVALSKETDERDPVLVELPALIEADPALAARVWGRYLDWVKKDLGGRHGVPQTMRWTHRDCLSRLLRVSETPLPALASFFQESIDQPMAREVGGWEPGTTSYLSAIIDGPLREHREDLGRMDVPLPPGRVHDLVAYLALEGPKLPASARPAFAAMVVIARLHTQGESPSPEGLPEAGRASELAAWAHRTLTPVDPSLADAVMVLVATPRHSVPADFLKGYLSAALQHFARSSSIPLELKLTLFEEILYLPMDCLLHPPETSGALAEGIAAALPEESSDDGVRMTRLIANLSFQEDLPSASAHRLAERMLSRTNRERGGPGIISSKNVYPEAALALAIHSGDPELMEKALAATGSGLSGRLDLILRFLNEGYAPVAARLVAAPDIFHRDNLYDTFHDESPLRKFSGATELNLPDLLDSIPNPQQRYRVECLLSAMPDEAGTAAPAVPRGKRLAALVPRFAAEGPAATAAAARIETLAALTADETAPETMALLLPPIVALANDDTLMDSDPLGGPNAGGSGPVNLRQQDAIATLVRDSMLFPLAMQGDGGLWLKTVQKLCTRAEAKEGPDPIRARIWLEWIFRHDTALLVRVLTGLGAEQRSALLAALDRSATACIASDENGYELQVAAISMVYLTHAAVGDGAGCDAWLKTLPRLEQRVWEEFGRQPLALLRGRFFAGADAAEARRAFLRAVLSDEASLAHAPREAEVLWKGLSQEPFTPEELAAVVGELPESNAHRAALLEEKARH